MSTRLSSSSKILSRRAPSGPAGRTRHSQKKPKMKTILVVDDYEIVRLYHSMFLTQKGFKCVPANDGNEALAVLKQQRIDLMLLDLVMPNMSGTELIQHIRAIPEYAALPVLAITSEAKRAEEQFGRADGRLRFLLKPVMPDTLIAQVRSMLTVEGMPETAA